MRGTKLRPLGRMQKLVLEQLRERGYWETRFALTVKVLESLVKRGLVKKDQSGGYMPVVPDYSPVD